ncbi:hypothetical protein ABL78_1461 [Leptomonas seymouri]|uniref:Uncharacterized protein n=1 Tax=Leptomonas seymouri TaxID=5684 RepID=A0A0N1PES3_LEPSE|nr:hypothetical protein ABL78_1461 [Leptomonas seymouri]|eukprot:KPI89425.1 hypothetical protein ABL78_1461 [Leptomonas seymouri]
MAFEALINTITLVCLVLFGLWIISCVFQAVALLLMRRAYRRHSKHVLTIPFIPLQTRLFHELAVPQFLASKAIQLGDLPPVPRALRSVATAEYVPLEVAPSLSLPALTSESLSPVSSVLTDSPCNTLSNTKDKDVRKSSRRNAGVSRKIGICHGQVEMDQPVAVTVNLQPPASESAEVANPWWWTPKLDGKCLVLGLQLPLHLQSTASRSLSAQLEKRFSGAASPVPKRGHAGRFSASSSNQRGTGRRSSADPGAGSYTAQSSHRRQPTVSLQLKQYRLSTAALLSLTAPPANSTHSTLSNLRSAAHLDLQRSSYHCDQYRCGGDSVVRHSEGLHAAIEAQLATAPMPVITRRTTSSSIPRLIDAAYPVNTERGSTREESEDPFHFDAIKYAHIRHNQRLLEVAVAEQTAMAHRARNYRKSAKRAQRIAAVLMQYLQYIHEDGGNVTPLDDSLADETGRGEDSNARGTPDTSGLRSGGDSTMDGGPRSAARTSISSPRRRLKQSSWVPLFGDSRDEHGGFRHLDSLHTGSGALPRRLTQSLVQPSPNTPLAPSAVHMNRVTNKSEATSAGARPLPQQSSSIQQPTAVVSMPLSIHEQRRSTRKRHEAALEIADSAVEALEALVERVRQAQTLRPRYQALLLTVNFSAERFIVRRGPSGLPPWAALSSSHTSTNAPGAPSSSSHHVDGGGAAGPRHTRSFPFKYHSKTSIGQLCSYSSGTRQPCSSVRDFPQVSSVNGARNAGVFAPEPAFTRATDDRAAGGASGGKGGISSPSLDQFANATSLRNFSDAFADETATVEGDAGAMLLTSGPMRTSNAEVSAAVKTLSDGVVKAPAMNVGSPASAGPFGSTSANNAAAEFLRASRQLKLDPDSDVSGNSSSNWSNERGSNGREGNERNNGRSQGPSLGSKRQRRAAEQAASSASDSTNISGKRTSLRRDANSVCTDGDTLRAQSQKDAGAPRNREQRRPSPRNEEQDAADTSVSQPGAAAAIAAPSAPRGPCETDLRLVYIIGADRATLLRSLTVDATQTFSAGTQNFLCFFTLRDEQRARRRYLKEVDRQYRLELQQRAHERIRVPAAPLPTEEDHCDSSFDEEALRSYRMQVPPAAAAAPPPLRSGALTPDSLRHTGSTLRRGASLGSSAALHSDPTELREDSDSTITPTVSRNGRYRTMFSSHSADSFTGVNTAFTLSLPPPSSGYGAVGAVHAIEEQSAGLDGSLCSALSTATHPGMEASLRFCSDVAGPFDQGRNSSGAATENAETHRFQTVHSASSSMLSSMNSMLSVLSQKENTAIAVDVPRQEKDDGDTAGSNSAQDNNIHNDEVVKHTSTMEGGDLQLLANTDNAVARSMHSVSSVVEHPTGNNMMSTHPHPPLRAEVSATSASAENTTGPKVAGTAAVEPGAATLSPHQPLMSTVAAAPAKGKGGSGVSPVAGAAQDANEVGRINPKSSTLKSTEAKGNGKKARKAAAKAIALATELATPQETDCTAAIASVPLTQSMLEVQDAVGDHDVRRYHAAIGITLPEQVFLLRDAQAEAEPFVSTFPTFTHSGGCGYHRRSTISMRSASNSPAHTHPSPSLTPLQSAAVPSAALRGTLSQSRRGARVLEGQVEVAELSFNVLSRQLGPFVPQHGPSASTRSHGSVVDNLDDVASSSNNDNSDGESSSSSHASSSCGDADHDSNGSGRSQRRKSLRQRKRRERGARTLTREEREARQSSRNKRRNDKRNTDRQSKGRQRSQQRTHSQRDAKSSTNTSASRSERRHRRRQREQQRRIAAWRRRILRKRAAASRAGYSPISVAMLFFTAPPQLPVEMLHRFQMQSTAYVQSAQPIPPWALGSLASGIPLGVAPRRASDSPPVEELQQRPSASICVTLIYTSTAEQVTETLLVARELAISSKLKKRALQSSLLETSLASFSMHDSNRSAEHHFRGCVEELREWQQNGERLGSPASRSSGGCEDDFSFPRDAASASTVPPSVFDSLHTRGRTRDIDSLSSTVTESPPQRVESGTATFTGDEVSVVFSDGESAEKRKQTPKEGRNGKSNNGSRLDDSLSEGIAAATTTSEESLSPPQLLLLTESMDSVKSEDDHIASTVGAWRSSTSVCDDKSGDVDAGRLRKEDTACFNDDTLADEHARSNSRGYRASELGGVLHGGDAVHLANGDRGHQGEKSFDAVVDDVVDVLRDSASFPDGVPVGVSLTYVRIGNDLYAVTEVVDRTFLQYREERVIYPTKKEATADGENGGDAASASSGASYYLDSGEDAEPRNAPPSPLSSSSSVDSPFSRLDAALEAIQNQHEATARQLRRRMHHRNRAVSTMNFGDLSYSLAGSAPVRPGTRRQEVHMCWRCLSAEAAVICLPCGHYAVCEECAELLADCCICKTPILSSVVLLERKKTQQTESTLMQQHQRQPSRCHSRGREQRPEQ